MQKVGTNRSGGKRQNSSEYDSNAYRAGVPPPPLPPRSRYIQALCRLIRLNMDGDNMYMGFLAHAGVSGRWSHRRDCRYIGPRRAALCVLAPLVHFQSLVQSLGH